MATSIPPIVAEANAQVYAVADGDTYCIHFPYSKQAVAQVKAVLDSPQFDWQHKCWRVSAAESESIPICLKAIARVVPPDDAFSDQVARNKREAHQDAVKAGREAIEAMPIMGEGISIGVDQDTIVLKVAYDKRLVAFLKRLGGRFQKADKSWVIPLASGVELVEARADIIAWHQAGKAGKSPRGRVQSSGQSGGREQKWRELFIAEHAPAVGTVMGTGAERATWGCVRSLGKPFTASAKHELSILGQIVEGYQVRYAYFETPKQAAIDVAQAAHEQAHAAAEARDWVLETIRADGEIVAELPAAARIVWQSTSDLRSAYCVRVLKADGYLYLAVLDRTVTDVAGVFPAGPNLRLWRVIADPELLGSLPANGCE